MSIAAFVTGLLGCFGVLGAILGFVSLRQISARGGKGRGLAIAGIVLSCLWVAAGALAYALGLTDFDSPSSTAKHPGPSPTKTSEVDARKMRIGDCINDSKVASTPEGESVKVESVKVVPCTRPHDGEVMATFRVPGGSMPPEQEMMRLAATGCEKRLTKQIRRDPAAESLSLSYYYPTSLSWRLGDRSVTCVVVSATEGKKLTRPIRKS
ncbi:DUF4190 domain-containing protein [Actinomadura spongiicola]|uniref:DUF4190 domain-containing protein n=1 Tax=Actinomadura spongiicola TaxID=2303421 RepID=A0A372GLJ8_9ACTN|nr:DUF4190 domain-containing protein [Actinomadura spongiicola]RFS86264.1 DUF4190 domain-containing protein [Actinomadura spongiicola]